MAPPDGVLWCEVGSSPQVAMVTHGTDGTHREGGRSCVRVARRGGRACLGALAGRAGPGLDM